MRLNGMHLRRLLGWVLLASLFFSRLAAASYLCPMELAVIPAAQYGMSRTDCLNVGGDQLTLCADSFVNGRIWANGNGHSPDHDAPPPQDIRHPWPLPSVHDVSLHPLPSRVTVSAPIYLQTARLRL